ncbi:atp-binding cassette multidrug transporter [Neofusicoccum parvum]|uniref:Atp-binding cassette multidrug transporter n=1 Tax=Neofusicoccum parvum TaxID=310453 RepID=A0ACB5SKM9_9PEZI|nr:atp-binding cassette multidrug transporter [Neofusicoccum parvum]
MQRDFRGAAVYNGEIDHHFPYLTVAQTLRFAASTKTPRRRVYGITRAEYIEKTTEILGAAFGLRHTFNTRVGNDFVRGVSGGERRRVSIVEMLLTRASVTCWDNPTRGLDSSTSLDFAKALRVATSLTSNVSISALYQPGDNLAGIYDKVLLLHQGRQVWFGGLEQAKEYFQGLGFVCSPRETAAEFLVSVTDTNAARIRPGYEQRVPRTPEEFEAEWKKSSYYQSLQTSLAHHEADHGIHTEHSDHMTRFKAARKAEKSPAARTKSPFTIDLAMQFSTTMNRAYQRIRGEYAYYVAITVTMAVVPLMIGSMFYDISHQSSGFFSKGGVIFFIVLFNIIVCFAEISAQFSQRPIVEKQHSYAMYHPYVDALATMLSQYPLKIFNIIIFSAIVYFLANLKREAGAFFIFVLFTYITTVTMTGLFRTIAAFANTVETALACAGLTILPLAIYGGYIIPRPSMHPWFKWISYINPIYYTVEALMSVEFHGQRAGCDTLVPSGPGFDNVSIEYQVCPVVGAQPGEPYVLGDNYIGLAQGYQYSHVWRNLGISIAFFLFFTATYALTTELKKLSGDSSDQMVFRKLPKGMNTRRPEEQAIEDRGSVTKNPSQQTTLSQTSKDVFCWEDLNYDIGLSGGRTIKLLNNIQGFVEPGTLTALVGASGAGKTTLLNVLAQRVDVGVVSGNMTVNGSPLDSSFRRRTGYVQQQDIHMPEATVREALRFSALLRQPKETPTAEKYAYVENIISMLGMEEYADAVIGYPGRGLNVEKRKLTTIGLELVARPSLLLFLDEPTSGLDSQSAWSIIKLLRQLANSGQAILCTIHQPSAIVFEQFDRMLALKSGGQTVYFGDLGNESATVLDYFERNGAPRPSIDANPAEYILDLVGAGATAQTTKDWAEVWTNSPEYNRVSSKIRELKQRQGCSSATGTGSSRTFEMPWISQYLTVQKRLFNQHWRSPSYITGKLFINIVGGLFLGFTFYKEANSIQGLQNKMFSIFMILILSLVLIVLLQPRLIAVREVYHVREKHSRMYHWTVFVVANVLVEIPFNVVISSFCFVCWYFPVGFDLAAGRAAYMWFVFVLYQLYHASFSQAIAIVSPNAETAAMVTILFYAFILAFNGVLQPLSQLIGFWHFAYYVSPFTYLVQALMSAATHGTPVHCSTAETNIFQPLPGKTCGEYAGAFVNASLAALYNPDARENCQFCQYSVADTYLGYLNMSYDDRWRNVGLLIAYTVFNIACFFLGVYLYSHGNLKTRLSALRRK